MLRLAFASCLFEAFVGEVTSDWCFSGIVTSTYLKLLKLLLICSPIFFLYSFISMAKLLADYPIKSICFLKVSRDCLAQLCI